MPKTIFLLLNMLLFCVSCAGPALTSRVVHEESSWFVRLDSYQNGDRSSLRYEHPGTWTVEELSAILSRLLLEDRVGLMDSSRPPRPVFSSEEITLLAPAIQDSFQKARPNEWIAFSLSTPSGSGLAITSGGMFLAGSQLHVVVANHRTPLADDSQEFARVRANPFYSAKGSGGTLVFESSRFMMGTQPNWSGGHRASASELILDHRAFLSFLALTNASPAPLRASGSSVPTAPSVQGASSLSSAGGNSDPSRTIERLQEEIERLKKQVAEQEAEIARLKRSANHPPRATPAP
ncbi:MAG: hypothetical protein RL042_2177 [Nitrospirota bacterium]|jgi:hypothetical protein